MMQSVVISLCSAQPDQAVSASFGMDGGTIGRALSNTLVLDDPDRTVSRVHAQVVCHDGRYFILNRGSNPTLYNGHVLGAGNEVPLNNGDRLMIGGFNLAVQVLESAASAFAADSPAQTAGGQGAAPADPSVPIVVPMRQGETNIDSLFGTIGGPSQGSDPLAVPEENVMPLTSTESSAPPTTTTLRKKRGKATARGAGSAQTTTAPEQAPILVPEAVSTAADSPPVTPAVSHVSKSLAEPDVVPAASAPPVPAPALPPDAGDDNALLAAFLRGLQRMDSAPQRLTPALMERVGVLLRTATEGALQLLLARQQFKHELRAERTMIAAQDNNPLKFSPTVDMALTHLLGPGMRGFMPAEAAMRDAFDDLRAHQFAMIVGMQAALAQLITRFAPDEIEKETAAKSGLDNFFTVMRKTKLWDQFVQTYAGVAAEAGNEFDNLFDKAFVRAYEEQLERFKSQPADGEVKKQRV